MSMGRSAAKRKFEREALCERFQEER